MAALSQDPRSKTFRILFWFGGKQFHKSLKTDDEEQADRWRGRIEETLLDLERGRLTLPPGARAFAEFYDIPKEWPAEIRIPEFAREVVRLRRLRAATEDKGPLTEPADLRDFVRAAAVRANESQSRVG